MEPELIPTYNADMIWKKNILKHILWCKKENN